MTKLNLIGVRARDIDRIIDRAIQRIGKGEDRYSCCALIKKGDLARCWKVRKAYTDTFGPVTIYSDHFGYMFAAEVSLAATHETTANFRILMLSLFRVAWRDLV